MSRVHQLQERRLDELLRRQLDAPILDAIANPRVTEIIINEDGRCGLRSMERACATPDSSCRLRRSRA
jgi:hypothetical protein